MRTKLGGNNLTIVVTNNFNIPETPEIKLTKKSINQKNNPKYNKGQQ